MITTTENTIKAEQPENWQNERQLCEQLGEEGAQSNEEHIEEYVNPSLGRIGSMYFDERNNRIKFFSTDIHTEPTSIDSLVNHGTEMMDQHNATRLYARFFTRTKYDSRNVEAKISLNNGFSGIKLLFVGVNHNNRMDAQEVISAENDLIATVMKTPAEEKQLHQGYCIERLNPAALSRADVDSMERLYAEAFMTYTTVLDSDAIRTMVENSVVYAVRDNETGEIVSTVVAEIGTIRTPEKEFRICELSEMATRRSHRGQGLVTYATKALIEDIRNSVDLIYAESRSCHLPINQAFKNMGFNYAGRLNKQCILSGDHEVTEKGPYENLNVWYVLPHEQNS